MWEHLARQRKALSNRKFTGLNEMKILLKGGDTHEVTELEIRMLADAYPRIEALAELKRGMKRKNPNPKIGA